VLLFEIRLEKFAAQLKRNLGPLNRGIPYDRVVRAGELEALASWQRPDAALSMSFQCKNIRGEAF
jgi:hypothetical protein